MYITEEFVKANFQNDILFNEILKTGVTCSELISDFNNIYFNVVGVAIKTIAARLNVSYNYIRYKIDVFHDYIEPSRIGIRDIRIKAPSAVKIWMIHYYLRNIGNIQTLKAIINTSVNTTIQNNDLLTDTQLIKDEEFVDLGFDDEDLDFVNVKEKSSKNSNDDFIKAAMDSAKITMKTSGSIFEKLVTLSEIRKNLNETLKNEKDLELKRIKDLKDNINGLNLSIEQTVLKKQIEISNDILTIKKRIEDIAVKLEAIEVEVAKNKKQYFEQVEKEKQIIDTI